MVGRGILILGAGCIAVWAGFHDYRGGTSKVLPARQLALSLTTSQETSKEAAGGVNDALPPKNVTGALNAAVTQGTIKDTICIPGYARSVRPALTVTEPIKRKLMLAEHHFQSARLYELDHLVPLSIGGAPDDLRNLWLESWNGPNNAHDKDALEYVLWRLVCDGEVPLATAQTSIATNWIAAYKLYATPENLARFHFNHGGGQ